MAEATAAAAANPGMERYNRYYQQVLTQLQGDQGPERSDSQLKNYLTKLIKPSYDQAIARRQQQTGQSNAAIDTDAASRGMGTSTWVTDAKNRQKTNEAADIATLNSNYSSALYDALLNQINQRDQNRMNLMSMAQGIAGNMYDRWKAEEDAGKSSGGGGGFGGGGGGGSSRRRIDLQLGLMDDGTTDPNYGLGDDKNAATDAANRKNSLPGMSAIESNKSNEKKTATLDSLYRKKPTSGTNPRTKLY